MISCLQNIIGLSRTTCPCLIAGIPVDAGVSLSGYYLEDLEYLSITQLNGASACEPGNVWDIMQKSRDRAVDEFPRDLMTVLMQNHRPRREALSVNVGEPTWTADAIIQNGNYAGQLITPFPIRGGYMTFTKFGIAMNAAVPSLTLEVYDDYQNISTPIGAYTLVIPSANNFAFAVLTTPLVLPMTRPDGYRIQYRFVYQKPAGAQPKNNAFACQCGGRVVPYLSWMHIGGVSGPLASLGTAGTTQSANGLMVYLSLNCAADELICNPMYPLTFDSDGIGSMYAKAIRFNAGVNVMDYFLKSTEINRYTMMNRDVMASAKESYQKSYDMWLEYIATNMNTDRNDCLMCKTTKIFKGNIMV